MQNQAYFPAAMSASIPPCFLGNTHSDGSADPLPDVPIMPSTRLQLELLLQEPVLDLRAVSEVILADVGATLQIFRLVGEEYPAEEDRPTRMEDCIASLNAETWFEAVCASTLVQNSAVLDAWQHARRIGQYLEQLAGCDGGPCPWEAQLVGLLHEVGRLPEVLGWQSEASDWQGSGVGALLAEHWHLPECVLAAAREQEHSQDRNQNQNQNQNQDQPEASSVWANLLSTAHAWAWREDAPADAIAVTISGAALA